MAGIYFAFYTRMLFSCLVDADFLDTELFMIRVAGLFGPMIAFGDAARASEQLPGGEAAQGRRHAR